MIHPRPQYFALLAAAIFAACASSPETPEAPQDPALCAELVARHRADPTLEVDVPPRGRNLTVARVTPGTWRIRMVVDEEGRVDPGLITVDPTPPDVEDIRYALGRSRFYPARVNGCAVPSVHTYTIRGGPDLN